MTAAVMRCIRGGHSGASLRFSRASRGGGQVGWMAPCAPLATAVCSPARAHRHCAQSLRGAESSTSRTETSAREAESGDASLKPHRWLVLVLPLLGCTPSRGSPAELTPVTAKRPLPGGNAPRGAEPRTAPSLPLVRVADVPLPGRPVRFDYQDFDPATGNLVIAHMNDASVVIVRASDGSVVKVVHGIPTARGVVVADDAGRIFVTSSPNQLVILDNESFAVLARVKTGRAPDGDGWDPAHRIVAVSDQADGAVSLLADAGTGTRRQVRLGRETGNVVFDAARGVFWVTVVKSSPPDYLVAVDPVGARVTATLALPGCEGAHGLRLHPDGRSALIACEDNAKLLRVDLASASHPFEMASTGAEPDVMALDPGLGWLYVAAESGELRVFDLGRPGLVAIDSEHPGDGSHSVAVDPKTHHVFFPLVRGPEGTPVLRIMKPAGTGAGATTSIFEPASQEADRPGATSNSDMPAKARPMPAHARVQTSAVAHDRPPLDPTARGGDD